MPPRQGPVARLADLLALTADGSRPTSVELAELLWLSRQMDDDGRPAPTPPDAAAHDVAPSTPVQPSRPEPPRTDTAPAPPPDDRVPLRLPEPTGAGTSGRRGPAGEAPAPRPTPETSTDTTLRVPVPPMVTHPLALQRALRPLKRRVPSPVGQVIDEEATAHRIARLGGHPRAWLPVLRPADERWLRLCLVYDAGPTMPIWRPLVHELHTAFAQSGIFRTVELHRADPDGTVPPLAAHAPATGRTVVLLISDCMGPQWRPGPAGTRWYRVLRRWARQLPLALIQPLPERLWRTTALPTTPGLLSAPHPAAPSAALTLAPYGDEAPPADAVPVPVLEPSGTWLSHWASLVADAGGGQLPGAVGWLPRTPSPTVPDAPDVTSLTPEDLVLNFRSTASPEAFRLAGHLAVGEPRLKVMRLVQAAVEERPRPQHLAEVILSGMLSSGVGAGAYEFRSGVRELLLRTLPRTARGRTRELLARVGGLIDERAGVAPGELRAVASTPGGGGGSGAAAGDPFATVSPESVRQLGTETGLFDGRYRFLEQLSPNGTTWRAEDVRRPGSVVVVKQYPMFLPYASEQLDRLVAFRHENVAPVVAHGIAITSGNPVPYWVTEFVPGASLQSLLFQYRGGLRPSQLLSVVPPLASAVKAITEGRLSLQTLRASQIVVTPTLGPVLTGDFALNEHSEWQRRNALNALASLVDQMKGATPTGTLQLRLARAVEELRSGDPDVKDSGLARLIHLSSPTDHTRSYSLLGPLRVTQHGHRLAVDAPEQQAVLCMLLLNRGRTVPFTELIQGIWATVSPRAEGDLRAHAHRLANTLAPDTLIADDIGYTLPLPSGPDVIDLFHAQRLHDDARDARFAGDPTRARELIQSALDLWRGTPLKGVPGPAARATRTTIGELRLSLLRMREELTDELGETERETAEREEILDEFPHTEDEVLAPHEELPSAQLDDLGVTRELPDDQPTPPGTTLTFEYVTRPSGTQSETLHKLGREISHLLIVGGIGPDHFELRPRPRGWDVAVTPEVHVLHALTAMLHQLPAALAELPHIGLGITVTHEPDPTVSAAAFPAELRHVFNRPGSRAVVIVSNDLHDRLTRSGRMGETRFEPVPQSDDWYCELTAPAGAHPAPTATSAPLSALLAGRTAVVLGFDGPVVPLYTAARARAAVLSLMGTLTESLDVDDALAGRPPLTAGELEGYEGGVHPADVLRAQRDHGSAGELRARLRDIEWQSLQNARPTPHLPQLLNTLAERGLAVAVAGDCDADVMAELLTRRGLADRVSGGAHGRRADSPLLPDPDCLRRSLLALDTDAGHAVMIGSSSAELLAARRIGLPFVGYRRDETSYRRLRTDGCELTLDSLASLIDAVRGT
ncbi:SAV_2336 N-terminal domain-related protein [Streptomyces sp. NPDC050658]|uniref:SAV_2336 N-terminal domain-related protein n=1 Tax=unclassified Streptomyces TaxID=2593676 RepID=UPI003420EDC0